MPEDSPNDPKEQQTPLTEQEYESRLAKVREDLREIMYETHRETVKEILEINQEISKNLKKMGEDLTDYHRAFNKKLEEIEQRLTMLEQKVFGRLN